VTNKTIEIVREKYPYGLTSQDIENMSTRLVALECELQRLQGGKTDGEYKLQVNNAPYETFRNNSYNVSQTYVSRSPNSQRRVINVS
jgi:hypothetical protein